MGYVGGEGGIGGEKGGGWVSECFGGVVFECE